MREANAMAGYLVKLARELTGAAVKDQVPVNAPSHFRRLRASQGLLPPPYKNPEITGALHLEPLEAVEAKLRIPVSQKSPADLPGLTPVTPK
jgi:hypothetical protein